MAILAVALVCGIPASPAALLLLKSESERVQPFAEEQFTTAKTDRLASSSSIITLPPLAEEVRPPTSTGLNEDPIELIRGSIADVSRAADLPTPPARKRPQKRNADRTPPTMTRTANAMPAPAPPLFFETMFSLRTLLGQTSPQT